MPEQLLGGAMATACARWSTAFNAFAICQLTLRKYFHVHAQLG